MANVVVKFKDSQGNGQVVVGSKTALKGFVESLDEAGIEYKVVNETKAKSDGSHEDAEGAGTEKEK